MFDCLISKIWNYRIKNQYSLVSYPPVQNIKSLATLLYPNGIWIRDKITNIENRAKTTHKFSKKYNTIYRSAATYPSGLWATVDIMHKVSNKWNLIEVYKYNVSKKEQIADMAFKKFVYEMSGYTTNKCFIIKLKHLQKGMQIKTKEIFDVIDITSDVYFLYKNFLKEFNCKQKRNKTIAVASNSIAYIDYTINPSIVDCFLGDSLWLKGRPNQMSCRILNNEGLFNFSSSKFCEDVNLAQIEFLLHQTRNAKKIFIHNAVFEQAHHRELYNIYPSKTYKLQRLNKKLVEWDSNYRLYEKTEKLTD